MKKEQGGIIALVIIGLIIVGLLAFIAFRLTTPSVIGNVVFNPQNSVSTSEQSKQTKSPADTTSQQTQQKINNDFLEFNTFRVYNPDNNSKEAILIYSVNVNEVSDKLPIIKVMPPLSLSGNHLELADYLKNSRIETLYLIGNENEDIEIGKIIRRTAGVSVISKFARA
jgi:hypothetical protein